MAPTRKIFRVSEWGFIFHFRRGAIHILRAASRGRTVIKRPTEEKAQRACAARSDRLASLPPRSLPPSLPLAVAAPLPELPAADAARAPPPKLCTRFFSLSNRASRRRRIIATAKGGTGTDGRGRRRGERGRGPQAAARRRKGQASECARAVCSFLLTKMMMMMMAMPPRSLLLSPARSLTRPPRHPLWRFCFSLSSVSSKKRAPHAMR